MESAGECACVCHICLTSIQMDVIKVDYTTCKYVRFYQSDTLVYLHIRHKDYSSLYSSNIHVKNKTKLGIMLPF